MALMSAEEQEFKNILTLGLNRIMRDLNESDSRADILDVIKDLEELASGARNIHSICL